MIYRIELADREFNTLDYLEREASGIEWNFKRLGGCGSFSFDLPRSFCNEKHIGGRFNIKIKRRNPTTKNYDTWYQGLILHRIPKIKGKKEYFSISGSGYQQQLSEQHVKETYDATEVSVIVKDILDTYITPNTDITYSSEDIEVTSFTPSSISFNTDALTALQTLADTVGSREWGVDKDRKFYFKARSSDVGFIFPIPGPEAKSFTPDDSFEEIFNRVKIIGGTVDDATYEPDETGAAYNDLGSQEKYGLIVKRIQNSSIIASDVAEQYAQSYLAEFSDVVRKASCTLIKEQLIEATTPIDLFQFRTRGTAYGEKKYGTFLYSGRINYKVNQISYSIDDVSSLLIDVDLGQPRPSIAEDLSQLEYQINQLSSAGA